jgi:hypothetical protein
MMIAPAMEALSYQAENILKRANLCLSSNSEERYIVSCRQEIYKECFLL